MPRHVPARLSPSAVLSRARDLAPEAFVGDRVRNLYGSSWQDAGTPATLTTPVDGTPFAEMGKVDQGTAQLAVAAAAEAHRTWGAVPWAERRARVAEAVELLQGARDELALLLAWEIGKPWRLACADVDRCLDGVRWYLDEAEAMLAVDVEGRPFARTPLPGPVSNIASWNYPMSVLVHAELVQVLAGNAVLAKTPSQGGAVTLTLAHALMARAGLPVTLLSGVGADLSAALVRSPQIGALAFVGGRSNGGAVAAQLVDTGKRHVLEQEGLNAWGIWGYSDWGSLAGHLRKGFEYAKQRCTAYPRFVVQRELVDSFLATYLPVVQAVRFGHPLAVDDDGRAGPPRAPGCRTTWPRCRSSTSARSSARPRPPSSRTGSRRPCGTARSRCTAATGPRAGSWTGRTPRPTTHRSRCSRPPGRPGSCTPSRSDRSTPSWWWTPRPSCSPR